MKRLIPAFIFCFLILGCSKPAPLDPVIQTASDTIAAQLTPTQMSHSGFFVLYPKGKPSQFVNYYFSPMGKSEWPPSNREAPAGTQSLPEGITIVPFHPDITLSGKQLVIRADDDKGEIVLEAYDSHTTEPLLSRHLPLTVVTPDAATKLLVEDNLSMGISFEYSPKRNDELEEIEEEIEEPEDENP